MTAASPCKSQYRPSRSEGRLSLPPNCRSHSTALGGQRTAMMIVPSPDGLQITEHFHGERPIGRGLVVAHGQLRASRLNLSANQPRRFLKPPRSFSSDPASPCRSGTMAREHCTACVGLPLLRQKSVDPASPCRISRQIRKSHLTWVHLSKREHNRLPLGDFSLPEMHPCQFEPPRAPRPPSFRVCLGGLSGFAVKHGCGLSSPTGC